MVKRLPLRAIWLFVLVADHSLKVFENPGSWHGDLFLAIWAGEPKRWQTVVGLAVLSVATGFPLCIPDHMI